MSTRAQVWRRLFVFAPAYALAGVTFWLLWRSIFQAYTEGFDTMLYARSLWGVARGIGWNPISNTHVMAIHAHVTGWIFAPLTYVFRSAAVIAAIQAISLGALWIVTARAIVRLNERNGIQGVNAAGVCAAIGATLGSPLVLNPFTYDPRPDLLGVVFLAAALLDVVVHEAWRKRALVLLLLATLSREEFGLISGLAIVTAPVRAGLSFRARITWALALASWTPIYYAIGNVSSKTTSGAVHFEGSTDFELADVLFYKGQLLLALVFGGAPFLWKGWRWLGSVIPGAIALGASQFVLNEQLQMHYPFLMSGTLVVATVAGYARFLKRRTENPSARADRSWIAAGSAFSLTCFIGLGAWPGGLQCRYENFDLLDESRHFRAQFWKRSERFVRLHAIIDRIPEGDSVAADIVLGARLADRDRIRRAKTDIRSEALDWVLLSKSRLAQQAALWRRSGYQVVDYVPSTGVLLVRPEKGVERSIRWEEWTKPAGPACSRPQLRFPLNGFVVCTFTEKDDRPIASIARVSPRTGAAPDDARSEPFALSLIVAPDDRRDLLAVQGIMTLQDLPYGRTVRLSGRGNVPATAYRIALTDREGRIVEVPE